ncbi:LytTR family DNA-binding domain-containing protein [Croceitalea sp. MTPC5]|uniref:LytR/AlgR family response regulator transcription factor n=1 Tax=Croceitalea sp. MTPC5 TaxID=3056565 RepID=UPI002B36C849|nr:LytTR family DNA-binding domain-containing protein [Croceitalea sp. MTPC5]
MAIKCIIIDDEPLAISVIKTHLKSLVDVELVGTFENSLEAFEAVKELRVDLIFLDIEMPLLTGLDFIKTSQTSAKIILTTAHRNYAPESYELEVVDYLLKPISFSRLFKAINKFKGLTNLTPLLEKPAEEEVRNDHIYVNSNKKFIKVNFDNISHIESIKDYIRIHTGTENIITKDTISNFEQKLPTTFLRVHRSYIVNTQRVTAFTKMDVELGKVEIPIGASYKNEVLRLLKRQ